MTIWGVLGLLAVTAAAAWWQRRPWRPVVVLTCLAPLIGLAAWPCLVVAIVERRWLPALVAAALALSHLAFTLPTMHPWSTSVPAAGTWRLTVYSHNVLFTNDDLGGVAGEILGSSPDIVAIEELSHANIGSLQAAEVMAAYPHRAVMPHERGIGLGVWSRWPMTDVDFWQAPGYRQFQASIHPAGGPAVSLIVVHAEAPVSPARARLWLADLRAIAARIDATTGPTVVVGDFNATTVMRAFRPVLATGIRDAATSTGNGWRASWPASQRLIPRVMRIDHALHSPDLTATSYHLGTPAGSDHRPVVVTLARA